MIGPKSELALGALGVQLPAAEDLEHLGYVEQMLFQRRRVPQTCTTSSGNLSQQSHTTNIRPT